MGPVTLGTHKRILQGDIVQPLGLDPKTGHSFVGAPYRAERGGLDRTHEAMEELAGGMSAVSGLARSYHRSIDTYSALMEARAAAQ